MILAIDAGNSRVKWGWHDGRDWASIASVSLIEFAASSDHVNPFSVTHADPERIVISNVAGEGAHHLLVNWTSIFDAEPLWLRAEAERCAVRNRYERPEQLGPDRWAALIAARALHSGRHVKRRRLVPRRIDSSRGRAHALCIARAHWQAAHSGRRISRHAAQHFRCH
jgi:type III pantothenate kinase